MEESEVYIMEDHENDVIKIFYRQFTGRGYTFYTVSDGLITEHTADEGRQILPLFTMPLRFGKKLLSALNMEIEQKGINQRANDKKEGKADVLESQLKYSQDQLSKLINHLVK